MDRHEESSWRSTIRRPASDPARVPGHRRSYASERAPDVLRSRSRGRARIERPRDGRTAMTQVTPESTATRLRRTPVGTIHIVDPHPLNWLYITWNTMEEPIRTDVQGHLTGAAMEESRWVDDTILEVRMRRGVRFQDGEACNAHS